MSYISEREFVFTLLQHPIFSGEVINKIIIAIIASDPAKHLDIELALNWQPLTSTNDIEEAGILNAVVSAVLPAKQLAQEKSKED